MLDTTLTVNHPAGLHARPAADFVRTAAGFSAQIQVRNLTLDSDWADAKSILSVLTLRVEQGYQIQLQTEGSDEQDAMRALVRLIETDFKGELE